MHWLNRATHIIGDRSVVHCSAFVSICFLLCADSLCFLEGFLCCVFYISLGFHSGVQNPLLYPVLDQRVGGRRRMDRVRKRSTPPTQPWKVHIPASLFWSLGMFN